MAKRMMLVGGMLLAFIPAVPNAAQTAHPPAGALQRMSPSGYPDDYLATERRVRIEPAAAIAQNDAMLAEVLSTVAQKKEHGWIESPPERAAIYQNLFKSAALKNSMEELAGKLRIVPAEFGGTLFEKFNLLGARQVGGLVDGGWTGLARVGTVPLFGRVVLTEYDYRLAGSFYRVPEELVDYTTNGFPVQHAVHKASNGSQWTEVRWFTETKEFQLWIERPIMHSDKLYKAVQELTAQLK